MEYPQYDYAVIGGDMRQVYLAEELAHHQNRVIYYALMSPPNECRYSDAAIMAEASSLEEAVSSSQCVICPIPFSKNSVHLNQYTLEKDVPLEMLPDFLKPGQTLFAGCISEKFQNAAMENGTAVYDLMKNEDLSFYNTIAAAEGAVCEAILKSPLNLHHSQCAVLGYGKCGHTLVNTLKGLSCYVSVCSNQEHELALANTIADKTVPLSELAEYVEQFDFVFNTIPAKVLTAEILNHMKTSVTIIDIASAPGGIDYAEARHLGINASLCPGLPGKYAPFSSAKAIKTAVETVLSAYNFTDNLSDNLKRS